MKNYSELWKKKTAKLTLGRTRKDSFLTRLKNGLEKHNKVMKEESDKSQHKKPAHKK